LSTNGSTPLMMAAREGKEEIAGHLLGAGARGNIANEWGDTAVTWAVRNNNLRIAQQIAGADFAQLASQLPASPPPVVRSQPVPDQVDKLLVKARRLESFGRFAEAAKLYREAFGTIRRTDMQQTAKAKSAEKAKPVSGLVITARRGNPQTQTAGLQYQTLATGALDDPQKVGAGETAAKVPSPTDPMAARESAAEAWLRQAREHEAAGRKREALMAYRQASAALRSR
jgi:tetratricopeptide (TPR) repeat protein